MHRGRKSERYPWNRKTEEKCLWNICHMVPVYITNSLQQFSFRSLLLAMKSRAFDVISVCRVCALDSHSLSLCLSRFLSFSLLLFLWSHIKRCARCISLVVRSKIVFIEVKRINAQSNEICLNGYSEIVSPLSQIHSQTNKQTNTNTNTNTHLPHIDTSHTRSTLHAMIMQLFLFTGTDICRDSDCHQLSILWLMSPILIELVTKQLEMHLFVCRYINQASPSISLNWMHTRAFAFVMIIVWAFYTLQRCCWEFHCTHWLIFLWISSKICFCLEFFWFVNCSISWESKYFRWLNTRWTELCFIRTYKNIRTEKNWRIKILSAAITVKLPLHILEIEAN